MMLLLGSLEELYILYTTGAQIYKAMKHLVMPEPCLQLPRVTEPEPTKRQRSFLRLKREVADG